MNRTKIILAAVTGLLAACQTLPNLVQGQFPGRSKKQYEAIDAKFMVVSQGRATSLAAREVLLAGGNAFDAFAAASFAISVERPQSTGLGGGGFLVAYNSKLQKSMTIDFREKAPLASNRDMYLDKNKEVIEDLSWSGGLASGVPGTVKGVLEIHKKFGRLSRKQIMAPAIRLAQKGFPVYAHLEAALEAKKSLLWKNKDIRSVFFKTNGNHLVVGDTLKQEMLAETLRRISNGGSRAFYRGKIADQIVSTQKKTSGIIRKTDLKKYEIKYRNPIKTKFNGFDMVSMPPPSSGGVHVGQILKLVEMQNVNRGTPYAPSNIHATVSAMKLAYRDRARYMGDSDYMPRPTPVRQLLSDAYLQKVKKMIDVSGNKSMQLDAIPEKDKFTRLKPESSETTHFTIADAEGNTISSTQTINGWFGSGVFVEGAGFVMNNQMDDFSAKAGVSNNFGLVGGKENSIAPQKRPLSSMSPTIFLKNKKPILALGTPSGSRIINCVAQVSLQYLYYQKSLWDAQAALRYHHQWLPDKIRIESPGFGAKPLARLQAMGYATENQGLGCKVQAIAFESEGIRGVSDPRGEGLAVGSDFIESNLESKAADNPNNVQRD